MVLGMAFLFTLGTLVLLVWADVLIMSILAAARADPLRATGRASRRAVSEEFNITTILPLLHHLTVLVTDVQARCNVHRCCLWKGNGSCSVPSQSIQDRYNQPWVVVGGVGKIQEEWNPLVENPPTWKLQIQVPQMWKAWAQNHLSPVVGTEDVEV